MATDHYTFSSCIFISVLPMCTVVRSSDSLISAGLEENPSSKLLTREQEHVLGTRIQTLMRFTDVGQQLSISLEREPTLEEWAESFCMTPVEFKVRFGAIWGGWQI